MGKKLKIQSFMDITAQNEVALPNSINYFDLFFRKTLILANEGLGQNKNSDNFIISYGDYFLFSRYLCI